MTARRLVPALAGLALAATPALAQTSLTLYNDGRVLVRRTLPVALPKGASDQRLELGPVEPASLFPTDPEVSLARATYDGGLDEASVLRRLVGRALTVERPGPNGTVETTQVTLLGVDPARFRLADGSVVFGVPGRIRYPADAVPAQQAVQASFFAVSARPSLRLGWFTDGAQWSASYQVMLGAKEARVSGSAVVTSSTLAADDAELQLLAGAVNRAAPRPVPMAGRAPMMNMAAEAKMDVAAEERAGEFHLYTVPGKATLRPGATTTLALFEPVSAAYEKRLVVRSTMPYWGFVPQVTDEQEVPVEVTYSIKRALKTAFGDLPIPAGVARIYTSDRDGRTQLVGEASVGHVAAGEDLNLYAGNAFDLTAKRVQTAYTTKRDSLPGQGIRTVATLSYKVTLKNATDSAATVDVREERGGEWSVVSSSVPAERLSSSVARFKVAVPAKGEATLTYRLRVVW